MVATPPNALRRIAGFAFALMLFNLCLAGQAMGQSTPPPVIATAPAGLTHPTGWGTILQTAIDSNGDWLVVDYPNGGLFEFPANGGPMITLAPEGDMVSDYGNYANPSILIDPGNNLYLGGNYANCLFMFPYSASTNSWPTLTTMVAGISPTSSYTNMSDYCGTAPYTFAQYGNLNFNPNYFQPWGIAVGNNNNLLIGSQDGSNFIFNLTVAGAWSNPSPAAQGTAIIAAMTKRPNSIASDPAGNLYFVEDSGGLPGVYEIPASVVAETNPNGAIASDAGLTRVDPNLPNVTGVVADAAGNLYISDGTEGVFFVPNPSGTPETSNAVLVSAVPAQGEVAIDAVRHILYVPTTQTQSNGQADVAKVTTYAEFGASAVRTATTTPTTVSFTFNASVTPSTISIIEAGVSTPDFSVSSGGTCATGTAYAALSSCTENITFTPQSVGSKSAKLVLQSASGTLVSITLHGTGTGAAYTAAPSMIGSIGSGLKTPSQVMVDAAGNTYVADAGLGQVLEFAVGASDSVSIGTGLTAPTGVAVDGAGDVFIADSGNVYEVPYGPSGLVAASQATLATGLGSNLRLAADGLGNLYVADPSNARVVELSNLGGAPTSILAQTETFLTTGFEAPSAVAVDSNNNLYVIDGSNLFDDSNGTITTALSGLSGATGLAVDPAGSVYLTSSGATVRIPVVSGALSTADETTIDSAATAQASVAIDSRGNVYLAPAAGGSIAQVSSSSVLDFGNVALNDSPSLDATITSTGNTPLSVTGYASSNSLDYTAADGTCVTSSPIAPGATCEADVTLSPGPGEQGTLTGQITLVSNAPNATAINTTAVSAALTPTTTSVSVGSGAEVVNTTVTITVSPQSGTDVPTGQVTFTYTASSGTATTVAGTLSNGVVTFPLVLVHGGSNTFTAKYEGDRVFGRSTGTATPTIAKSAVTMTGDQNPPPFLPYVLSSQNFPNYSGQGNYWEYSMPETVTAVAGQPTGIVIFETGGSAACPQSAGSATIALSPTGQVNFATDCLEVTNASITTYRPMMVVYTITPVYSGDDNYQGTTGQPITFNVLNSPAVLLTSAPSAINVTAGSSASANLTLNSVDGYGWLNSTQTTYNFTLPIAFTCNNLPPYASCSFSYPPNQNPSNSVGITCTGTTAQTLVCAPENVTVTLNTNVAPNATSSDMVRNSPVTIALMIGFGLLGITFRRKLGAYRNHMLALGVTLILFGATACSTKNLNPETAPVTPKGTYTIGIVGTQTGSITVSTANGPVVVYGSQNQVSVPFTMSVTVQ